MPRGDLVYADMLNSGMRVKNGMPPSHNCVWVHHVSKEKFAENWDKIFSPKEVKNATGKNTKSVS